MAKIEVNTNSLNSNFSSQNNVSFSRLINVLDKLLEDRSATLHIFGKSILQISRSLT